MRIAKSERTERTPLFDDLLLIIPYQITQNPEESKHPKSPDRINFLSVLLVTFDILLENEEYSLGCLCK